MKTLFLVAGVGVLVYAFTRHAQHVQRGDGAEPSGAFSGGVSGVASPSLGPVSGTSGTFGSGPQAGLALGMNNPRMTIMPIAPTDASPDSTSTVDMGSSFHPLNF